MLLINQNCHEEENSMSRTNPDHIEQFDLLVIFHLKSFYYLVKTAKREAKKTIKFPRFSSRTVNQRLQTKVG